MDAEPAAVEEPGAALLRRLVDSGTSGGAPPRRAARSRYPAILGGLLALAVLTGGLARWVNQGTLPPDPVVVPAAITPARAIPPEPATPPDPLFEVPIAEEGDVICPGTSAGPYMAELFAWDEIAALLDLGLPACDVEWQFTTLDDAFGRARVLDDGSTALWIESRWDLYVEAGDARAEIRSTVRHEFGHALVWMAGWSSDHDDAALGDAFPDALTRETSWDRAQEVAAEAVGVVLGEMRGDEQVLYYFDSLSDASMAAARQVVDRALAYAGTV